VLEVTEKPACNMGMGEMRKTYGIFYWKHLENLDIPLDEDRIKENLKDTESLDVN
jgi:hypothetical protein